MNTPYKPETYNSLSPYLLVNGAADTIDFLKRVFAAEELRRIADDDGRLRHAEVRIDDTVLMLADRSEHWAAEPAHVHVYVPDVDATYRRALEAGATAVQEPAKKDDPDRRGGFQDAGGTIWWIATKVE
ncbi:MAG: VOC family protein [Ardenticatenaceae bacterium]|nr:VOC family protein [Anaerolineales bacterium]MCB8982497.1 VOC family protein [Ardenticatenaceae bacterium]